MPSVGLADDVACLGIEGSELAGGAMSQIVMSTAFELPGANRQQRRSAFQGLYLALFVHAQYQGAFCRIHIEPHDIAYLVDEQWVFGEFEVLVAMRLQGASAPAHPHPGCETVPATHSPFKCELASVTPRKGCCVPQPIAITIRAREASACADVRRRIH